MSYDLALFNCRRNFQTTSHSSHTIFSHHSLTSPWIRISLLANDLDPRQPVTCSLAISTIFLLVLKLRFTDPRLASRLRITLKLLVLLSPLGCWD